MRGELAELRIDLRLESMRMAINNALTTRTEEIQEAVNKAVASFDLEHAIEAAVHKELNRAVQASVEFQLSEAVKGPARKAIQRILLEAAA
jgi:hypothetical protein